ncbi:histidine phosphatase family protein [Acetomicrobium hydrogeniformans]|uniref:Phosphoglycerate mutase family protein n=1 Tax=Acetomicrobium hydrogeniformans ATCC BAA-1850 TaxID=592015 RepID=A0A0T5XBA8_9BACT|nr:histidine phosphatase family protein [Acetomicrobium hydrogeniformans]KRT35645.1 phosphoglycerate mutase family protein [Acetomicrobium hydrogeniformans ATCC BAA-1850]
MRRLIFLRHGKTEWNGQFRYQGKTDVPLNDEGRMQADRTALRLNSLKVDVIYASVLSRARETAERVSRHLGTPLGGLLEELVEMDFGNWEGMQVAEVENAYKEVYAQWRKFPEKVKIPGGESFVEVVERVNRGMKKILDDGGENVLIVAHGGSIRAALTGFFAMDASAAWRTRIDNCSLTSLELWRDRVMLSFTNDTLHLLVEDPDFVRNLPVLI